MRIATGVFVAVAVSQMGATDCGGNALRDPGFDLWCGEGLCAWKVERGEVVKVSTWNEGDPGVELAGDDVAIEQLSPVTSSDGSCLEFSMIANIESTAQVTLDLDIFGDGSIEHSETIPTSNWALLTFELPIQGTYGGIRFELAKRGTGTAVLAQVGAKVVNAAKCDHFAPAVASNAPLGAPCAGGPDCGSGICAGTLGLLATGTCVGCTDGSCGADESCGYGAPASPVRHVPTECVANAAKVLGETCARDAECASSLCVVASGDGLGECSSCRSNADCAAGQSCGLAWGVNDLGATIAQPAVCAPSQHLQPSGGACASNGDCASSMCNGAERKQCDDGRSCATAANCPVDIELKNGPCRTVGIQGGSCQ
jgi:hypothetical protein